MNVEPPLGIACRQHRPPCRLASRTDWLAVASDDDSSRPIQLGGLVGNVVSQIGLAVEKQGQEDWLPCV
jgi:hypothetical protein